MALGTIEFADYPRNELRAILRRNRDANASGMPDSAIEEIVDLACHAAASARQSMLDTLDRASDGRITRTALGLATSLVASDCKKFEEALRSYAEANGKPLHVETVTVNHA